MTRLRVPGCWLFWASMSLFVLILAVASTTLPQAAGAASRERLPAAPAVPTPWLLWPTNCIDCPRQFGPYSERTMRLDKDGHPHLAYGGDHLYYAWYDGVAWQRAVVDPARGVGGAADLALDENGKAQIVYCDSLEGLLKHALEKDGQWLITSITAPGYSSCDGSLALDAAGRPHVAYTAAVEDTHSELMVASLVNGSWSVVQVDTTGAQISAFPSLVLDSDDHPHISYGNAIVNALSYAEWNGRGWSVQRVETFPNNFRITGTALALASNGYPHIAFEWYAGVPSSHVDLIYVHWTNPYWETQRVDTATVLDGPALALDAANHPRIAYSRLGQTVYTALNGSGWDEQLIDDANAGGGRTALELDQAGQPYVSYGWPDLTVAQAIGSGWELAIVDHARSAGLSSAQAFGADGAPHVAYVDSDKQLNYVRWLTDTWRVQTVYTAAVGSVDLALDGDENPAILFFDERNELGGLKYARWNGAMWEIQTVDPAAVMGAGYGLALDTAGTPHIGYADAHNLKYARKEGGAWAIQIVDGGGGSGWAEGVALVLDSQGRPHLSYNSVSALKYAYWTGSLWELRTISTGLGKLQTALVLDTTDTPTVAYCGPITRAQLARWKGASWEIRFLDDDGDGHSCADPALVLTLAGQPQVSYGWQTYLGERNARSELRYVQAVGAGDSRRQWQLDSVDLPDIGGSYNATLALGSNEAPSLTYFDPIVGDLFYTQAHDCSKQPCSFTFLPAIQAGP